MKECMLYRVTDCTTSRLVGIVAGSTPSIALRRANKLYKWDRFHVVNPIDTTGYAKLRIYWHTVGGELYMIMENDIAHADSLFSRAVTLKNEEGSNIRLHHVELMTMEAWEKEHAAECMEGIIK